jgi:glyoxylase-like metal-dependent hydrolase (beta-lactamase superfamily II)
MSEPRVEAFFHRSSGTLSYLVHDKTTGIVIDPVVDLTLASGRLSTEPSDEIAARIDELQLNIEWILETHAHADHLTGGDYLRKKLGARLGIGKGIRSVQANFEPVFDLAPTDDDFDHLFDDNETVRSGALEITVMSTPGHTNDSVTYLIGNAAFVGDTLFAPARGTARCDFPGGSAEALYQTIQRLYQLPDDTRLYLCHDYPAPDEQPVVSVTVAEQRAGNLHVKTDTALEEYVRLRETRDATLSMPALIIPALQVNIRAGALPAADANGTTYLRLPLNAL